MAKEKTSKKAGKSPAASKKSAAAKSNTNVKATRKPDAVKAAKLAPVAEEEQTVESKVAKASVTTKKAMSAGKAAKSAAAPADKLMKLYKWFGILYLVQGLAILLFGRSATAPLTLQYPSVDSLASEATGHQVVGIANRHVGDIHLAWVLAVTMIVFAVIHLMVASARRAAIGPTLERGVNAFRWLSLGIGGGLLVVATALVSGISSIPMLLVLFGSIFGSAMLTLGVEAVVAANNGAKGRLSHFLCSLAALSVLLPWLVFAIGVLGVLLWDGKLPIYLYSVYICQVLLVAGFMMATHFRIKRQGKWADSLYSERGYMYLTFIAVTVLSWQIVVGALK